MKNLVTSILGALVVFCLFSCVKDSVDVEYQYYSDEGYAEISKHLDLPSEPLDYTFQFPEYYNGRSTSFDRGQATLGRVLFYDINLSEDRSVSCASCHKQELAFADDVALSEGVQARRTSRNSLALGSVFSFQEYYGNRTFNRVPFFWDNRASSVQEQSEQTFANDNEMNMDMHQVVSRVREQPYYAPLFKAAYGGEAGSDGSEQITEQHVLDAVSVFVNAIGSFNAKYDQELDKHFAKNGNIDNLMIDFDGFNAEQNRGKALYISDCAGCHGETNGFPGELSSNNGLDMQYEDQGEGSGLFKVPTLRNITLTGPFMHDGRFETLDDVLDHYSNGIQNHNNLGDQLKQSNGQAKQFNYSQSDREALKAFMETFVDQDILTDERYADPFFK